MTKPRILITGASGFIGTALIRSLAPEYEVWAITWSCPEVEKVVAHHLRADLSRDDSVEILRSSLPSEPFFAVLHLAACTPRSGEKQLAAFLAANTLGTERLLSGLPVTPHRFAYFSTVDVYGRPGMDAVKAEEASVAPESHYAISKYAGERVALSWCGEHGLPYAVFRLGQVYGPNDPTGKVIAAFCGGAAAGLSPTICGTGDDMRQPIHVWDVVGAVAAWLKRPAFQGAKTFLLAGRERVSIGELAHLVSHVAGISAKPRFVPCGRSMRIDYLFNTEYTENELQWSPAITLRMGIAELLKGLTDGARRSGYDSVL